MLTTLDFWKSQGIGGDVFYIETISRHCDRQQSTKIGVEGKVFILVHNFSFWSKFLNVGSLNLCLSMGKLCNRRTGTGRPGTGRLETSGWWGPDGGQEGMERHGHKDDVCK